MNVPWSGVKVYLVLGATDMRKAIDGLSLIVADHLDRDVFQRRAVCILQSRPNDHQNSLLGPQWVLPLAKAS